MEEAQKTIINFFLNYGIQIIGALIILGLGAMAAKWLGNLMDRWLIKKNMEPPLRLLLCRMVRMLVFGFTAVLALDKFGIPIAPMVAGIGVAGVGIGLAMQGVLSNVVAGLTIIFTKPFRVGEYIELLGVQGKVEMIALFSTTLIHPDRSKVVIPNRKIVGEILHNYGSIRQLDLTVGVAYSTDLGQAIATVREILTANPLVLQDPPPVVGVSVLADSSINLAVKPWVSVDDYNPASAGLYQTIVECFRDRGISIPFPQREVRVLGPATLGEAVAQ